MPDNILSGGIEELYTVKENILELNGFREKYKEQEAIEDSAETRLEDKENVMNMEIQQTLNQRKNEIIRSYDEQIDEVKNRLKKINTKKEKAKNVRVSKRIEKETDSLTAENKQLRSEARTVFKKGRVPFFCNSRFYFSLFAPKGLGDAGILILFILITLLAIPCGIYYLLLPDPKIWMLILIYFIDIIVFGGLYALTHHMTKEKHPEEIKGVRQIRNKILINKKKIKAIKNSIVKDPDESHYGLDKYDKELLELDNKVSEIAQDKSKALKVFEKETKAVIIAEINSRYQKELDALNEAYQKIHAENTVLADKVKDMSLKLVREYEGYLGKDCLTPETTDQLIAFMEDGRAKTVSEAIAILRTLQ